MDIDKKVLEKIIERLNKQDFAQILAGLMILSKDLSEFLSINAFFSKKVRLFQSAYFSTLDNNRDFGKLYARDLFVPIGQSGFPHGFAEKAMNNNWELEELYNFNLKERCIHYFGWELFKRFKILLKPNICKDAGPLENANSISRDKLILELACCFLKESFDQKLYWYAISVYIAALFVRSDYEEFCEPFEELVPNEKLKVIEGRIVNSSEDQ